jgi:uncharacterized delta-60 repeat protein
MGRRRTRLLCAVAVLGAVALGASGADAAGQGRLVHGDYLGAGEVIADGHRLLLLHDGTMTRIDFDGSADRSFGDRGTVSVGSAEAAVQPDGKILVAGSVRRKGRRGTTARVTRLLPDGRVDRSFGRGGGVNVDLGGMSSEGQTVAVAADGDVLLGVGRLNSISETDEFDLSFAVARFTADGSRDRSFGHDGVKMLGDYGESEAQDIAATPAGGIVIQIGNNIEMTLFRLKPHGALDRRFGGHGYFSPWNRIASNGTKESLNFAPGFVELPDGRLLLAATGFSYSGVRGGVSRALAVRLTAEGHVDRTYGRAGWAVASQGHEWTLPEGLTSLPGGAVAIATSFDLPRRPAEHRIFGAVVFGPDGHLDRRFGPDGRCLARLGGNHEATGIANVNGRVAVLGSGADGSWLLDCPPIRQG